MADFDWSRYVSGGATRPDSFSGMNPQFSSALSNMFASAPPAIQRQLGVSSGYRSPARQAQLYRQAVQKYGSPAAARRWVAPPGNSQHNKGNAADLKYLSPQAKAWVRENAPSYGLSFPLSNEPWHIELSTARNPNAAVRSLNAKYVPQGDIPTPTSAPDIEGILSGSQPVSPAEYASYSSPLSSVQRAPLKDVDMRVQQPTMQTLPELSYNRFATTPFDEARFASAPGAAGKNALRRGLLDQQLDAGILPSLDNPAYAAMAQPDVPLATAYAEPSSIKTAAVQPPAFDAQPGLSGGLLSPQEQKAVAAQRAYLDQQPFNAAPSQFGSKAKQAAGSILGAVLGGLTLGPVGALGGGLLGNVVTRPGGLLGTSSPSYFPEAPKSQSRGDGSLTSYGRSVANSSGQFSSALSSGKAGLW